MAIPQNICSSGQFLLAGRCGTNLMSLEGKCQLGNLLLEKDSSGCPRGFDV